MMAIALLLLAACAPEPTGPERYSKTAGTAAYGSSSATYIAPSSAGAGSVMAANPLPPSAGTTPGVHIVAPGETLYAVSRKTGVPIRALIEANGLQAPYHLREGQRLQVPSLPTYTVQAGDTLFSLARRFGVEVNELARVNGIQEPYTIKSGEVLVVPAPATAAGALAEAPLPAPPAAPSDPLAGAAPAPAPPDPLADAVPPQGTLPEGTASGTPTVQPGPPQPPPPEPLVPEAQPVAPAVAEAPAPAAEAAPAPATAPAAAPAPTPQPAAAGPTLLPDPPARGGSKFIWPVDGTLISSYGPKSGGLHNDGINIAAPRGAPIKAADNGVVAYVGNELRGFGNLILVKHQGDYVTAYAHADQILVKRGQIVRRGETIGRVGSTGAVDSPQLHFEIRRGSRATDPLPLMTSQTASN